MEYYEKQIIRGVKEGDENAFRSLYDNYYHRLFCISRQYLQDDFLAETIVSDVFFHLWETRKTLDIQISLNAYLIRMVRNFSLNYLQKNYVEKEVSLNGLDITSPLLFLSDEYPLGRLLEKEMSEKLHEEINRLPKETRQVFILSRLEELKHEEIAERLGISVNTVKYHIKQALSILRDRLKDYQLVLLACLMKMF
ncbi:RNA polymerase sigma-70 factor [Parabacteroides sp. TM07-1AC]|uniref:RNA polymerase sigma-70 factor n=1 Tax=Parabacteroides sp. TM07-1AC TaxID=2292363 RepID=UPI000EFEFA59|nr:RNA polymerase sigma-70 factor [Parabacteroides sp. TM07-1AC]RHU24327.1 RNA polymerase sigma-70 factor [Parabacteroides sp. TM07-1AC]